MPGQFEFPRRERLTRRKDFQYIFERGDKRVGRAFVIYVARRQGQGRKFGTAVSRKVGRAVVRNRIKRYLREIYRTHRPALRNDVQIVVVARTAAAAMSFDECRAAMQDLFRRGGALGE